MWGYKSYFQPLHFVVTYLIVRNRISNPMYSRYMYDNLVTNLVNYINLSKHYHKIVIFVNRSPVCCTAQKHIRTVVRKRETQNRTLYSCEPGADYPLWVLGKLKWGKNACLISKLGAICILLFFAFCLIYFLTW